MAHHEYEYDDEPLSRSEKKRRMTALQDMGQRLSELAPEELKRLDLPADLLDAILDYQSMTKHEARRRQMQYIGKVMREIDTDRVEESLASLEASHDSSTSAFHQLEELRERLLEGEGEALDEAVAMIPPMERGELVNRLRSLVRTAQKERAAEKPPKAYRALFRLLRELSEKDAAQNDE